MPRREKFNFKMLNVPVGSTLTFNNQEDVICKVTNQDPPQVFYCGIVVNLTKAAEMALGSNTSVNGTRFWRYEGELLWDRRMRLEESTDEAFEVEVGAAIGARATARRQSMENNDFQELCSSLAEKLRAMLNEELGEDLGKAWASDKRRISILFGITYANELDEVDADYVEIVCHAIASRVGLSRQTYGPLIQEGRNLAQYVDVKEEGENQPMAAGPESREQIILDALLSIRKMLDSL